MCLLVRFQVTFPYYAAFNSLLAKMELIKRVYVSQARGNLDLEMTKEEFLQATQSYAQITPYEVRNTYDLRTVQCSCASFVPHHHERPTQNVGVGSKAKSN